MPHLKLLGAVLLETDDAPGARPLTRQHPLALLALLASAPRQRLTRSKLVGLLWPESPEDRARPRLNTCVYHTRRALGDELLVSSGDELRLQRGRLRCDFWSFREALEASRPDVAVRHYAGPFLDGFELPDSPPFEKWLDRQRARVRTDYREALETLAVDATERGDLGRAARWWQERFHEDPYDGRVVVRLMEALARQGKRAAAVVAGQEHVRRLAEELGLGPDAAVLECLERVQRAAGDPLDPGASESSEVLTESIAVLPFDSAGVSEDAGSFAVGLHADLLTDLSRVPSLVVISRTSVLPYRDTKRPLSEIGADLGVRYVLEGELQQAGSRIRLRAQLIDAQTDTYLWAERWDRELSAQNLFELQSELAREIVARLRMELAPSGRERWDRRPTADLDAYRLFVTGRAHLEQRTMTSMQRGVELFREAIERDGRYAAAWAGLAEGLALLISYQHLPPDPALEEAERAARRAVELDPSLAEAHSALGYVRFLSQKGPSALRSLYRAVELRPGYAHALTWLGVALGPLGYWEEGILHMERAARLDPSSPEVQYCLGERYVLPGSSVEECLTHVRRAQELSPGYAVAHLLEGRILADTGDPAAALPVLRRSLELASEPTRPRHLCPLIRALVSAGRAGEARSALEELEQGSSRFFEGAALAALGDADGAFERLRRAEWTPLHSYLFRYDPALDRTRRDPRFEELLREVNLAWGLTPDGGLAAPEDGEP